MATSNQPHAGIEASQADQLLWQGERGDLDDKTFFNTYDQRLSALGQTPDLSISTQAVSVDAMDPVDWVRQPWLRAFAMVAASAGTVSMSLLQSNRADAQAEPAQPGGVPAKIILGPGGDTLVGELKDLNDPKSLIIPDAKRILEANQVTVNQAKLKQPGFSYAIPEDIASRLGLGVQESAPAPTLIAQPTPALAEVPKTLSPTYIVQPGDTMTGIAEKFDIPYSAFKARNPRKNFDLIHPGEIFDTSTDGQVPKLYVVKKGDNLIRIAKANDTSVEAIAKANNLPDPDKIDIGQPLVVGQNAEAPDAQIASKAIVPAEPEAKVTAVIPAAEQPVAPPAPPVAEQPAAPAVAEAPVVAPEAPAPPVAEPVQAQGETVASDVERLPVPQNNKVFVIGDSLALGMQTAGLTDILKAKGFDPTFDVYGGRSLFAGCQEHPESCGDISDGMRELDLHINEMAVSGSIVVELGTNHAETDAVYEQKLHEFTDRLTSAAKQNGIRPNIYWVGIQGRTKRLVHADTRDPMLQSLSGFYTGNPDVNVAMIHWEQQPTEFSSDGVHLGGHDQYVAMGNYVSDMLTAPAAVVEVAPPPPVVETVAPPVPEAVPAPPQPAPPVEEAPPVVAAAEAPAPAPEAPPQPTPEAQVNEPRWELAPNYKDIIASIRLNQVQQDFLQATSEAMVEAQHNGAKINPRVVVAQSIVESGWGTSPLAKEGHNIFSVKASSSWQRKHPDKIVQVYDDEFDAGGNKKLSSFKKYDSIAEAYVDYVRMISTADHYQDAVNCRATDEGYLNGLVDELRQDCSIGRMQGEKGVLSYATSTHYVYAVLKMIENAGIDQIIVETTPAAPADNSQALHQLAAQP